MQIERITHNPAVMGGEALHPWSACDGRDHPGAAGERQIARADSAGVPLPRAGRY